MGNKSPDKVDVDVGLQIRLQRQMAGLAQTTLADALGVTVQQISKYEQGVNRLGAGRLTKIANALKIPVGTLLGFEAETGKAKRIAVEKKSPLHLIAAPGALALLRAYAKLPEGNTRRALVGLVEEIACRPASGAKRR